MERWYKAQPFLKGLSSSAPIHEQVRDYLLEQITLGTLSHGDLLPPERVMAEEFKVSRHSIRQALSALDAVGLIEVRHGSGIYLTATPPDAAVIRVAESIIDREGSVTNVAEARRGIEPYMARLAAERRTPDDLIALEPLVQYISDEEAADRGMQSSSFHRQIARASKNLVFDGIMRTLITGRRRAEAFVEIIPFATEIWEREHREIFDAIHAGDGDGAEHAMKRHLDSVLDGVRNLQREEARSC